MKTFKTLAKKQSFAEIYQQIAIGFCFAREVGDDTEMIHDFVVCRDFLGDLVTASHLARDLGTIYSFHADGANTPIYRSRTCLLIHLPKGEIDIFEKQFHILNDLEQDSGLMMSSWQQVKPDKDWKPGDYIKIVGDVDWQMNSLMISIYSHILRCLCIDTGKEPDDFDNLSAAIADGSFGTNTRYCKRHAKVGLDLNDLLTSRNAIMCDFKSIVGCLWGTDEESPSLNSLHYQTGLQTLLSCVEYSRKNNNKVMPGSLASRWAQNYVGAYG